MGPGALTHGPGAGNPGQGQPDPGGTRAGLSWHSQGFPGTSGEPRAPTHSSWAEGKEASPLSLKGSSW